MKINDWLSKAITELDESGVPTSRLDALVMLADIFAADKSYILAHPDLRLSLVQLEILNGQLRQRVMHLPLAYIRGKTEFYGREFIINKNVLEPRPESEAIIDLLKELPLPKNAKLIDLGTGSGALGITAALEIPNLQVSLVDIDASALKIAKINAQKHDCATQVIKSNLFNNIEQPVDVILANLPYVPNNFRLNKAAMNEPAIAIFGGEDGLDLYRQMFMQTSQLAKKPLFFLTESLPTQHTKLSVIAKKHSYILAKTLDFIQLYTFIG